MTAPPRHRRAAAARPANNPTIQQSINPLLSLLLALTLASPLVAQEPHYVNAELPWHPARVDSRGQLLAWYEPEKNLGYDQVLRLGWEFIEHRVPADTVHQTGLKVYLLDSTFDGQTLQGRNWQHNPAMVFASFVDGLCGWYPYSGDMTAVQTVREMLDYQLAHGTTPTNWDWAGVPFATSCGGEREYGRCIADLPHDYYGGLETDKVGEMGVGYALFYQMTGESNYLDAARRCADTLARHVRAGDDEHTPWPFRVDGRSGTTLARADFGGDIASCVRLFDELLRLGTGDAASYRKARDLAWNWILRHPLNPQSKAWRHWSGFFEDVSYNPENVNQMLPTMVCYYILTRPDPAAVDPDWKRHVGEMLDWVRQRFGRGPFLGAWGIDEQGRPDGHGCCSRAGLGSHTGRWAAVSALYAERAGDAQAREDAFRSLNYVTYFTDSEGRVSCCGEGYHNPYWFSDGYSDYLRNFTWTMGALPELAPVGQNHLLRSSSVVQQVTYAADRVSYRTFDPEATEVLRLNFRPAHVRAGDAELREHVNLQEPGFTIRPLPQQGDYVLRIRHHGATQVTISP
ncbi:MAG: hypothetical protein C5B50_29965 [Verrucomicrobia bacterium]|nr:MAG: hypothetical protein C5B50_29965 [Verrucomicrobiota bacterium]